MPTRAPPSNTTSQWYLLIMSATSIVVSLGITSGRRVLSTEFTDTTTYTWDLCNTMGPPADIEYAVEPVGVATITPSLLSCQTSFLSIFSTCSINTALLLGKTATSFSTGSTSLPSTFTVILNTSSTS